MRAALYARVSSDPNGQARSVVEQEAECRQTCERQGWEVVRVLIDNDKSASRYARTKRPAYAELVAFVESGGCDVLVTWEASRFQRDLEVYVQLRELCRRRGVLWSYSGRTFDLERVDDRLMTGLDALLAERESDMTRERVLRSVRANALKGRPHGKNLFGYRRRYDEATGELLSQDIDEAEAAVIREAADRFVSGEPTLRIANDFNARGLRTPLGREWNVSQVRRFLTNPAYAGKRVHQGKVIGEALWEPILDQATWNQLQVRFSDPRRVNRRDSRLKYLLSGIARCGVCGAAVKCYAPRGYPSYLCHPNFCVARKMAAVDALVVKIVLGRLAMPDALAAFTRDDEPSAALLEQVSEKRARLESFYESAAAGEITAVALGRIESRLLAEIAEHDRQLHPVKLPNTLYDLTKRPAEVWEHLSIQQQREVIRTLVDVRILKTKRGTRPMPPESIQVTWKGSDGAAPAA